MYTGNLEAVKGQAGGSTGARRPVSNTRVDWRYQALLRQDAPPMRSRVCGSNSHAHSHAFPHLHNTVSYFLARPQPSPFACLAQLPSTPPCLPPAPADQHTRAVLDALQAAGETALAVKEAVVEAAIKQQDDVLELVERVAPPVPPPPPLHSPLLSLPNQT